MTDNWDEIREKAEPVLETLKSHPWKSSMSLAEMVERQAEGGKETESEGNDRQRKSKEI